MQIYMYLQTRDLKKKPYMLPNSLNLISQFYFTFVVLLEICNFKHTYNENIPHYFRNF